MMLQNFSRAKYNIVHDLDLWKELSVKVLSRNANPEIPDLVIKDVQQDIPPAAAGRCRISHTSTPRRSSRCLGAGKVDVDTAQTTPDLTRAALTHFTNIPKTALFHAKAPMAAHGAWPWCLPSVFDLGNP
ncbi:hypothetical protein DL767_002604 [Monosporascus sp. MG133]|nr:hypothetical protein DL767_002604 [Monosporascus sp. MG133]